MQCQLKVAVVSENVGNLIKKTFVPNNKIQRRIPHFILKKIPCDWKWK